VAVRILINADQAGPRDWREDFQTLLGPERMSQIEWNEGEEGSGYDHVIYFLNPSAEFHLTMMKALRRSLVTKDKIICCIPESYGGVKFKESDREILELFSVMFTSSFGVLTGNIRQTVEFLVEVGKWQK